MKKLLLLLFLFTSVKAQVPYGLSSNPSARPTAFLDFDGQTVTTPYWNKGATLFCLPSVLTNEQMIRVFNQVAEDYRPFTINITTDSAVYFAAPITKRTRIIITPTNEWYSSAGGTSYIESFRWGLDIPCFAFDDIFNGNDKRVAEVVSHEVGHTLGLYHQSQYANVGTDSCRFVTEYFSGRGTGDIGWSPIMGNSYFRNLTLWATGLTTSCNFPQNDITVITNSLNGVTLLPDDVGNTLATARVTSLNSSFNGILTDSVDVDYFRFDVTVPGRFTLNAVPYSVGASLTSAANITGAINHASNIDIELTLLRNNDVLSVYNPTTRLDATIDTLLNPGTYYVKLNSVSNSNTTRYGMIGSYRLLSSFGGSVVVPVYSLELKAINNKLYWDIIADEPLEKIWMEISYNNKDFIIYKYLENKSGTTEITIKHNAYYRLATKTYYSNIVYVKSNNKTSYKLISNIISNQIEINTDKPYDWMILELSGRHILKGKLNIGVNKISVNLLSEGMYIIYLIDKNDIHVNKIIKKNFN